MLDLWGISFHAVIVFGLGKNLLFKYVLGHCVKGTNNFTCPWRFLRSNTYIRTVKILIGKNIGFQNHTGNVRKLNLKCIYFTSLFYFILFLPTTYWVFRQFCDMNNKQGFAHLLRFLSMWESWFIAYFPLLEKKGVLKFDSSAYHFHFRCILGQPGHPHACSQ